MTVTTQIIIYRD